MTDDRKMPDKGTELAEQRTEMAKDRTARAEHRTEIAEHRTEMAEHRTEMAEDRTSWATRRTALAEERTLMAWIRTSLSLLGFGFTIYKFFQYLREAEELVMVRPHGPRNLGIALIALGVVAVLGGAVQYRQGLKSLGVSAGRSLFSVVFVIALLVALLGMTLLASIALKLGPF